MLSNLSVLHFSEPDNQQNFGSLSMPKMKCIFTSHYMYVLNAYFARLNTPRGCQSRKICMHSDSRICVEYATSICFY
jgi:hypothetical protein